jgi:tetratricopeptide (TPR) repeat protein
MDHDRNAKEGMKHPHRVLRLAAALASLVVLAHAAPPAEYPGEAHLWQGEPALAIPLFRQTLERDPHDLRARLGLARALSWSNRRRESLPEFDTILQQAPDHTDALNGKADALSHLDRLEEAIAAYTRVLAREPGNLEARCGIARCRVWQGFHRTGRDLYLAILRDHPGHAEARTGLAFAQHWDGRDDQAMPTLAQLGDLTTNNPAARNLLDEIRFS